MALSDEEGEILPQYVLDYHFVDEAGTPVPFSNLPVQWDDNEVLPDSQTSIILRGTCDNGFQRVYMPVIAWKFELCYVHPEISVLTKSKKWIMLQKPRKAFEPIIGKIMVTVQWLHFIKKNPTASQASAWKHLQGTCSSYGAQPSVNDLLEHRLLITKAASRDKVIEESKVFKVKFLNIGEYHVPYSVISSLMMDANASLITSFLTFLGENKAGRTYDEDIEETEIEGNGEIFDQVCAICDDGGNILCCNGQCLRSFHPTVADGVEAVCASLGFRDKAEYETIPVFLCENCIYKKHQCFACGKLGSSARSSCQEVFPCASATCGHFYHPECVARLLYPANESQAVEIRERIIAGESFICPAHKCFSCKQHEDVDVDELQFAICRRCPKAYHRKCLPRGFVFQHESDENTLARAWENLLPNKRILIYCMDHEINGKLKTPLRNHLIFPRVNSELIAEQQHSVISKRTKDFGDFAMDRPALKKPKQVNRLHDDFEILCSSERGFSKDFKLLNKSNIIDPARKALNKISSVSTSSSTTNQSKLLSKNNSSVNLGSSPLKLNKQTLACSKIKSTIPVYPGMQKATMSLPHDAEMENQMLTLMEDISSSFDVEDFKKRTLLCTHVHSKIKVEKSIPLGLVEGSVKAVQTALQNLEKGCSIKDAKTICPPEVVKKIFRWKTKLKVYLAPFFHGARYTSFGRHFTQVEKLKEIVDRVQCYVRDGDMIVDFCCGSNDFSCLMKERLEKDGKLCSFKNYDIMQAKNDFSFEKRDWLKVDRKELPDGSRLIMGLNPPFGVNASLANTFINKALEFGPKLLVLIVPEQTQRLDEKALYNLIWEDHVLLSGKSFYLPGSVDMNERQMEQWNNIPPPLYLWSRWDWTAKHTTIARQCGHLPN